MKQKDIALIIVVVVVSAIMSLLLSNVLISAPDKRQEKVEIVEPITADFKQADPRYFNSNSIDPTQIIRIGDSNNNKPFSDKQ